MKDGSRGGQFMQAKLPNGQNVVRANARDENEENWSSDFRLGWKSRARLRPAFLSSESNDLTVNQAERHL